jgi:cytochrome P450
MVNIQAVHLDEKNWPDPMKYDPNRFLNGAVIQPFTFVPFIAGPRNCLGQHLALLESKMVVSMLAQRYRFQLAPGSAKYVEDWMNAGEDDPRHRYMVPVIPKEELMVILTRK